MRRVSPETIALVLSLGTLLPATARADDGPLFRFSANVLALGVVGGGASEHAMLGGGASIGLDYASIDILDLGLRARLLVAPVFTDNMIWGGPGWTGGFAVAARLHTRLVTGECSFAFEASVGPAMGQFGTRGDLGGAAIGVSVLVQPGLEWVLTPRFAMTTSIELGALIDVREPSAPSVFQGAWLVGIRAG